MARQLRIEFEGAFYHVTSRGNLRDRIFFADWDRKKFLEVLEKTKKRYGYLLHAYVLMDTHYHLLLETPKANLSQIMQNMNTAYTVYINNKYRRNGHLFQGRFKGIVVDKDEYLLALSRYIHLNPVRAGMVQKPQQYRWTSYTAYIHGDVKGSSLVDTADTLSYFSNRRREAAKAYKAFVELDLMEGENPFKDVKAGILLGGEEFRIKMLKLLDQKIGDDELPQLKRLKEKAAMSRIVSTFCSLCGKSHEELVKRGKNKRERDMAIYLSKVLSGKKNREVGDYFGVKGSTISEIMKKVETQLKREKDYRNQVDRIKNLIIEK